MLDPWREAQKKVRNRLGPDRAAAVPRRVTQDERLAAEQIRLVMIVRATAQLDVGLRRLTSGLERTPVMELDEPAFLTSPAAAGEAARPGRASTPHGAPPPECAVSPVAPRSPPADKSRRRSCGARDREQGIQRAVQDRSEVSRGQGMANRVLDAAQLVPRLCADRHLQLVASVESGATIAGLLLAASAMQPEATVDIWGGGGRRVSEEDGARAGAPTKRCRCSRHESACRRRGSRRINDGASGRGRSAATISSTSRLLRKRARASTARWSRRSDAGRATRAR